MFMDFGGLLTKYAIRPRGILHLGAHVGQEAEVYSRSGATKVVWVEANPELLPTLQAHVGLYPGQSAHLAAVSDVEGQEVEFHLATNGESSSLLKMKLHRERYPHILQNTSIKVVTTTVDALLRSIGVAPEDLDFVNMDLQGAEMKALLGMTSYLTHVRYLYTEVNFDELYDGCCLFPELSRFLVARGFTLTDTRPVENGWGEAFFQRVPAHGQS